MVHTCLDYFSLDVKGESFHVFRFSQSFLLSVLVVGEKEKTSGTVNIRTRDNKVHGERTISETIERLQQLKQSHSRQAEEEF